jgi:hypothetical protein
MADETGLVLVVDTVIVEKELVLSEVNDVEIVVVVTVTVGTKLLE